MNGRKTILEGEVPKGKKEEKSCSFSSFAACFRCVPMIENIFFFSLSCVVLFVCPGLSSVPQPTSTPFSPVQIGRREEDRWTSGPLRHIWSALPAGSKLVYFYNRERARGPKIIYSLISEGSWCDTLLQALQTNPHASTARGKRQLVLACILEPAGRHSLGGEEQANETATFFCYSEAMHAMIFNYARVSPMQIRPGFFFELSLLSWSSFTNQ